MAKPRKDTRSDVIDSAAMKRHGQWKDVFRRLWKNKLAMVGLAIVVVLVISAVFADVLAPYDPYALNMSERFAPLSLKHLLGTDNYGRDIFSRVLYGGRTSLLVSLVSLVISTVLGVIIGITAGYFGGTYDFVVMRIMDIIMAIPSTFLAIAIMAALGAGTFNTALAIAISGIPMVCRVIRGSVLSLRDQEYVEAATATGSGSVRIMFKHILPNTLAPILVECTLRIGGNILAISGLSFIGLGISEPTAEWGAMLAFGRQFIRDYWPLVTFPGVAIMLTLFGFNVFGDGLRDALDPRLKQ